MGSGRWVGIGVIGAGVLGLRRLGERGGASDAEARGTLPGDDVVPEPMLQTTHAISINARAEAVWPWLAQMGLYRAGWYADQGWWDAPINRYLASLTRAEAERSGYGRRREPSVDHIVPELQHLATGDIILDGPPNTAYFRVAALERNRALVLHSTTHASHILPRRIQQVPGLGLHGAFTWSFILVEANESDTRLILRTRLVATPRLMFWLFLPIAWPIDYLTTRRMLRGIKRRVEAAAARSETAAAHP